MFFRIASYSITEWSSCYLDRGTVYTYAFMEIIDLRFQFYGVVVTVVFGYES